MRINKYFVAVALVAIGLTAALTSCEETHTTGQQQPAVDTTGISSSGTMKFEGEIISVPSPIQVATLIQKNNISFNQELLNGLQNKEKYINETKKALNMGIFGTDLAYIANYNLGQLNNDYFNVVASLASELGILENVDRKLITKLASNLSNRDSLLSLNADFFRTADSYLKNNQRSHLSSYVLIGGWVESLHLTADAAQGNEELRKRLGEQKYSAASIENLVSKLEDPAFEPIRTELRELCSMFQGLESTYIYKQPITDKGEGTTYFRSETSVKIDDDDMAEIREQIKTVRNAITE